MTVRPSCDDLIMASGDLQVGDSGSPGGLNALSQLAKMSPLCYKSFCPSHCPKTEAETVLQDFFLYLEERRIVPLKLLHLRSAQCFSK